MSFSQGFSISSRKSPSVHGGSGGSGILVSRAPRNFSSASAGFNAASAAAGGGFNLADAVDISDNKKAAMQNLNDRLASYLEKVRNLERANADLELKIRQFLESKVKPEGQDYSAHYAMISTLQDQVRTCSLVWWRLCTKKDKNCSPNRQILLKNNM